MAYTVGPLLQLKMLLWDVTSQNCLKPGFKLDQ
jgi:hypothetical protein